VQIPNTLFSSSTTNNGNVGNDKLVKTTIEEESAIAKLTLNYPPVNSLSLEMCQAISSALKTIESNYPKVHGLVINSSSPSVFCAGLHLNELHNPDPKHLPAFWYSVQQVFIDLYSSRLATIAAIEGHAPAAGCMLAMSCDYRIMKLPTNGKKSGKIGLNETLLGLAAPPWMGKLMVRTIGNRKTEQSLALGTLYSPNEAFLIGLVDEVVSSEQVVDRAREEAIKWASIHPQGRVASKLLTRKEHIDGLLANRKEDTEMFCSMVQDPILQKNLSVYLESLKK